MNRAFIFSVIALGVFVFKSFAAVIYVNTGDSIQTAIDGAAYGDEILVAEGTYIENISLKNGVALVGAGQETTILDGNQNGSVVTADNCDPNTILEGFRITNGNGTLDGDYRSGGGVYSTSGALTVSSCTLIGNFAHYGGAMFNWESNVTIHDSRFLNNTAEVGGAIYYYDSNTEITRSHFIGNTVLPLTENHFSSGGALYFFDTDLKVSDCTIISNEAAGAGGAIVIAGSCDYQVGEVQDIINCIISQNRAGSHGGAVSVLDGAEPFFVNCTIAGNQVTGEYGSGGAISCMADTFAQLENSILWNNVAEFGSQVALGDPIDIGESGSYITVVLVYTDMQGGIDDVYLGEPIGSLMLVDFGGNIDTDPLFVDPNGPDGIIGTEDDDLHLQPWSPCIDAGDMSGYYSFYNDGGLTDLDSQKRVLYDDVDMGADEVFPIAGDIDRDGDVDLEDFSYFAGHWLKGKMTE